MKFIQTSLMICLLAVPQLTAAITLQIPNYKSSDCSETAKGSPNESKNGTTFAKGNPAFRGVCLFQQRATQTTAETKQDYLEHLAQEMVAAQQVGLGTESQNLASLVEGLAHCEQARLYWNNKKEIPVPGTSSTVADTRSTNGFCSERNKASGSLSDVKWGFLDAKQEGNNDFLEQMLSQVTACQSDVIGQYDRCAQIEPQRSEDLEAQVLFQVDRAMIKYFGCDAQELTLCDEGRACSEGQRERYNLCKQYGASAPASAMFSRKRDRVVAVGTASDEKLTVLENRGIFINNRYAVYDNEFQKALAIASETVNTYKAASLLTKEIADEVTRWENGLLPADVKDDLDKSGQDLAGLSDSLRTATAEAGAVSDKAISLMISDEEKTKNLVQACKIYYCALQNTPTLSAFYKPCGGNGAPPQSSFAKNSVCLGTVSLPGSNGVVPSISLVNLCKDLDVKYRKRGLSMADATSCLKETVDANKGNISPAHDFSAIPHG